MQCPQCRAENDADSRYCESCGTALARSCPSCGHPLKPRAKFCGGCGAEVQGSGARAQGSEAEPRTPHPEPLPEGERRQLTVLFCDLVGSTAMSQQLDAEEWRDLIAQYQQAVSGAVARFGGHVAKNLGDGLLIYFGWPTAREDDPERAVRAGLAILDALSGIGFGVQGSGSGHEPGTLHPEPRLSVRVGLHTGRVVIADGGEVFGETANVAARVQSAAEPDTVLINEATQRLVAGMFIVDDRGPQMLKGVRDPVPLYRVVQPSGVRSRLGVAEGRLTRFVGRDVELATLIDRWERAHDGDGQNIVVLGEAGVGKSRLVYQLYEHLKTVPHTWLECGATPYTEGTPFHPVIALVSQGLAFEPEDTTADKLAKLEVGLRALASAENIALMADFLGLPSPTRLQFSPELRRRKTIELLAQWNLSLSETQPLVLVVEDLHWCDVSTLELLGHLIGQSATARVLLLATARPEFAPPWSPRSNVTTLQLARLTKRQAQKMIALLVGTELPAATLDALVTRADGVPLYVEELTKTLAEPGTARGVEAIPASLADSLMARLDRLSAAKEVAQRAAVLGREFGYSLLAAMAGTDEAALRHGLARLIDAEILFARGEPPTATYTFKHALIQETAYQSLLKRTRQQMHERVAQVLEERFPDRVAAEPEVVARHYQQAGRIAEAIAYYQRAGEAATQRSAYDEAIGHLRRALGLVAALRETRERHRMELGLQMAIAAPLMAVRGISHAENEQAYARARELVSQVGELPELARVLAGMADAYLVKGDLATSAAVAVDALAAAERTGDTFDLVSAHYQVAMPLHYQGLFSRALRQFEQSIDAYDPGVHGPLAYTVGIDRGVQAHAVAPLGHAFLGYLDRARALSEEAVAIARRVQHPVSLVTALFCSAVVHFERREMDRGRAYITEVLDLAEELGFPFWLGVGKLVRGFARVESGEGAGGVAEMQQALVDLAGIGSGLGAPGTLALFSESLWKVGRHDDALGALALGAAQANEQGQHYYDAELHRLRAEILLDMDGDAAEEAEAFFGQALEIARRQEAETFELRATTSLARLWQRQGKRDDARDLLAPVYAWFTEGFDTRDLKDAKALLEELGR